MKKEFMAVLLVGCIAALGACHSKRGASTSGNIPPLASGMKTVYFDFDDASIRQDQVSPMQGNAQYMKSNSGLKVVIEGHCDERGTNEYNLALGDRRASSAQNYLTNLGVDPVRMSTVSYGEERPACAESNESCWSTSRRAEFRKQ